MKIPPESDSGGLALPPPEADAIAHSLRLVERMVEVMGQRGEVLDFADFMQLLLYEPGLGYYSGAAIKFGAGGDFVTAPEISPLFGRCLARQAEALFAQGCGPQLLEFGAGSGKLCAQILQASPSLERYHILDLSAELKQRQRQYLHRHLDAELFHKIEWLSSLPQAFDGIVVANEVLDAMPVHLLQKQGDWLELGVGYDGQRLHWQSMPAGETALSAIRSIESRLGELPQNYRCELNLNYAPWLQALAQSCERSLVLIIDYGYEQAQYYAPERSDGTLLCHYRHRVHADPLVYPGLQDVTAFVDFDACADAAETAGFELCGLVTQREFLLANGLLEEAQRAAEGGDSRQQYSVAQQVKTLSLPQEMGEKFKVLAMRKNLTLDLPAMRRGGILG